MLATGLVNRVIARSSLVPNDPVLDMRAFAWTQRLRDEWQAVRDEAVGLYLVTGSCGGLWERGRAVADTVARCPATARLLQAVPGLDSAGFQVLKPGEQLPARRGDTKALISCHLGLVVPRNGDARMRIRDRVVRWAEGQTLVFDDSYEHQLCNDSDDDRVVLAIRFARPLCNPGKWIADRLYSATR